MNTITNNRNIVIDGATMATSDIALGSDKGLYIAETHGLLKYVAQYADILATPQTAVVAYAAGTAEVARTTIATGTSTAGVVYTLIIKQDGTFGTAPVTEKYYYTAGAASETTIATALVALVNAAITAGTSVFAVCTNSSGVISVTGTINGGKVNVQVTNNATHAQTGLANTVTSSSTPYVTPKGTASELTFYGLTYTGTTYNRVSIAFTKTGGMGVDGAPVMTKWVYNYWFKKDGGAIDTMYEELKKFLNGTSAYVTFALTAPTA